MAWYYIALILGLAVGSGVTWLIVRKLPQDKIREINYERLHEEQKMFEHRRHEEEQEIQELISKRIEAYKNYEQYRQDVDEMQRRISLLTVQKDVLSNDVAHLVNQRQDISDSLEQSRKNAEDTARTFLKQQMELVQEQLDRALEQAAKKYQDDEESYKTTYIQALKECAQNFNEAFESYQAKIETAKNTLLELQTNIDVMVENAKREEQKKQETNFYRLIIPESDLEEIKMLRSIEPYLRDREALNKVIWKVYYEKPYTDLIGRVIGGKVITGIYKITNLENEMCYIGQAANISERWRQHIKRGLGAEAPTRNKLYPAMLEYGVENFSFEVLEECERLKLDEKEDYWQEIFHAKDFGYSIK